MRLRVLVVGGTRFIGRAIVDELVDRGGHDVLVVHRGTTHPPDLRADVPHLHADRLDLAPVAADLTAFDPQAVLDCAALGAADADAVLGAFPGDARRLVVLSSMDTYRAYGSLHAGRVTDAVPLDEESPVRTERYPYRGRIPGMDDYEKLDVEDRWLARGGTVCRLPMVFGPHDYQRREEPILRRVRAGRAEIPVGAGTALLSHGAVHDVARGVRLAMEADGAAVEGQIFNFAERRSPTMGLRARRILEAAGAAATTELVPVPDDAVPPDLGVFATVPQPLLVSSEKARRVLGWEESDPVEALRASVQWHLAHPPPPQAEVGADDFSADDAALERRLSADATP